MSFSTSVHRKAIDLTRLSLEMTAEAGSGHPTSAASLAHVTTVLLYDQMRFDPARPDAPEADRLVLSEGHACPIVYAAAADLGIAIGTGDDRRPMTRDDAMRLRQIDSVIDGHPNPEVGFPFFPAATGSLGQGLSIAAGLALAARLDGVQRRVFCILGDGESREGQVWEAVDFLVDQELRSVCPIFNCNGYGQTGAVSMQQSAECNAQKLRAFGMDVEVVDGHDPEALREAMRLHADRAATESGPPLAFVLRTTKGWGSPSLQGGHHHGKPATGDELTTALRELDETAERLGAAAVEPALAPRRADRPAAAPKAGSGPDRSPPANLDAALRVLDRLDEIESGEMATRDAFGVALKFVGHADSRVVALDGDVGNSTRTDDFGDDPDLAHRFFQCRIAEQNMMSCAVGLASGGKVPFVTTFGKFLVRAYDQLEMGLIGGFPLKLVGSHTGISLAADGPSQMALPDVAFCHALSKVRRADGEPLLYVLNPCDPRSAYALTIAAADHDGAVYLRTMRPEVPLVYAAETRFELGGFHVLEQGNDVMIATWGYLVHEAKAARDELAGRGIHAALVDLYSLPFDTRSFADVARSVEGRVLTLEDNYGAGLGGEVAAVLAAAGVSHDVEQMYVRRVPKSGRTPEAVVGYVGLSRERIANHVEGMLSRH